MFDISFTELLVIGVIALVVIGPERLPKVARTIGHLVGRAQQADAHVFGLGTFRLALTHCDDWHHHLLWHGAAMHACVPPPPFGARGWIGWPPPGYGGAAGWRGRRRRRGAAIR